MVMTTMAATTRSDPYRHADKALKRLYRRIEARLQRLATSVAKWDEVNVIGAVENATLSCFDQKKKKYDKKVIAEPLEIVSLTGNISIQDNRPCVHAHVMLSNQEYQVFGGHLLPGTKVFVGEAYIQELVGEPKVRRMDKVVKVSLWN